MYIFIFLKYCKIICQFVWIKLDSPLTAVVSKSPCHLLSVQYPLIPEANRGIGRGLGCRQRNCPRPVKIGNRKIAKKRKKSPLPSYLTFKFSLNCNVFISQTKFISKYGLAKTRNEEKIKNQMKIGLFRETFVGVLVFRPGKQYPQSFCPTAWTVSWIKAELLNYFNEYFLYASFNMCLFFQFQ